MGVAGCQVSRWSAAVGLGLALGLFGCARHDANEGPEEEASQSRSSTDVPEASVSIELTASDGTGLRLVELNARGAVQAPLAFTELHLTFENPEARILEGRFSIELPPGGSLSRFAMKIEGEWQEGEVVERKKARLTYDSYFHQSVDPALLEKSAGNRFTAKVFPIPARGRKELIVSYSHELTEPSSAYRLPLAGLPRLDRLQTEFFVDAPGARGDTVRRVVQTNESNIRPTKDLIIPTVDVASVAGLRNRNDVVARVVVKGSTEREPIESLTIAFDTSASRAVGYGNKVARLGALVDALAEQEPSLVLDVLAFDQNVDSVFHGRATEFGQADLETLLGRRALGASDFGRLLDDSRLKGQRLLLVTDGISTAGEADVAQLREALAGLGRRGVQRMDVILDASGGSDHIVGALVAGRLAHDGTVSSGGLDSAALVRRLTRSVLHPLAVEVPGASRTWPKQLVGKQPGDPVLVFASFAEPQDGPLRVRLSGASSFETEVPTHQVPGPLLARALASAEIDGLTLQHSASTDGDERAELRAEIVQRSITARVISDFTAMLVLETEREYARFDIDRSDDLELLAVGPNGLVLSTGPRKPPVVRPPRSGFAPDPRDDAGGMGQRAGILGLLSQDSGHFLASPYGAAFGVGDDDVDVWGGGVTADDEDVWGGLVGAEIGEEFGLVGSGGPLAAQPGDSPGIGLGAGLGRSASPDRRPIVKQRISKLKGDMDKGVVRRIARAHINEVRHCYAAGLERRPSLRGRVAVQFQVATNGKVTASAVESTTLPDKSVGNCIRSATRRWHYPKGADGNVVVTVAYDLSSKRKKTRPHRSAAWVPEPRVRPLMVLPPSDPLSDPKPQDLEAVDKELNPALTGKMSAIAALVEQDLIDAAIQLAFEWRDNSPRDVMALVALGEALQAAGRAALAARVYGSLIDLAPSDAPQLRYAASRLQALGGPSRSLAIATFARAVGERPDHPTGHRKLAFALLEDEQYEAAFDAIIVGAQREYPARYNGIRNVFSDDVGLVTAAWISHAEDPAAARAKAAKVGAEPSRKPSMHFVLSWETDANDIDLRVYDGDGHIAYYARRGMASGGQIYGDVTDGYGPESFAMAGGARVYPYRIDAHYFDRGPSGYGLGSLQVVEHDGHGDVQTLLIPYVLMNSGGTIRLHKLEAPLGGGH